MRNRDIAAILFNISTILSAQNGNPYRIRAYRRAARNLLRATEQMTARIATGKPLGLPGLGKNLTEKISLLATQGELAFYEDLCAELPEAQAAVLRLHIPTLGPKLAARIQEQLGTTDPVTLRRAAVSGKLQRVPGIGPRRSAAILNAVGGAPARQERMEL